MLTTSSPVFTNPALVVVHSNLYSPAYQGQGKWVIFHPATRKAFLAVGKDRTPEILHLLTFASDRPVTIKEILEADIPTNQDQIERLVARGLLHSGESDSPSPPQPNYLHRYQTAIFDYPFRDYTDVDWRRKDQEQMETYARASPPPPNTTPRSGRRFPLPEVETLSADDHRPDGREVVDLPTVARLLRYTFGKIGLIDGDAFGPWLRKTSPSGGARHPTEGMVFLSRPLGGISAGVYAYDEASHCLLQQPQEYDLTAIDGLDERTFSVLIRSRVERAMWRYRDPRSLRPVVIDSGHVIETLALIAGLHGLATRVTEPPLSTTLTWLENPEIALVTISTDPASAAKVVVRPSATPLTPGPETLHGERQRHFTNAATYFTFEQGALKSHVLWPSYRESRITLQDFALLTHCLYSRRQDRLTTASALISIFDVTGDRIHGLRDEGLLLPYEDGKALYSKIFDWAKYGWYLSLLAHLEVRAATQQTGLHCTPAFTSRLGPFGDRQVTDALLSRRTTRSFSWGFLTVEDVVTILQAASQYVGDAYGERVQLFAAALRVQGLKPGLYRWDLQREVLQFQREGLSSGVIREMTIGQECAGAGALTLWVVQRLDLDHPETYENDIMILGRIGQRICLAAEALNLGVFMTPALSDASTCAALGITDAIQSVVYSFTIGQKVT